MNIPDDFQIKTENKIADLQKAMKVIETAQRKLKHSINTGLWLTLTLIVLQIISLYLRVKLLRQ